MQLMQHIIVINLNLFKPEVSTAIYQLNHQTITHSNKDKFIVHVGLRSDHLWCRLRFVLPSQRNTVAVMWDSGDL